MLKQLFLFSLILSIPGLNAMEHQMPEKSLNEAVAELMNQVPFPKDASAIKLYLDEGADRFARDIKGRSVIENTKHFIEHARTLLDLAMKINRADLVTEQTKKVSMLIAILHILRTYVPDLKTRAALAVLNQVRLGQWGQDDMMRFPRETIELLAKLASVDPEAQAKWTEIGMPSYPLPKEFMAQGEFTREQSEEEAFGGWFKNIRRDDD